MNLQLNEKIAVITGAGSGIGKATALVFAKQGAKVILIDFNKAAGESTVKEIKDNGGEAELEVCDVSDTGEVKRIFSKMDKLDILVNCAGVSHIGNAENTSEDDMDRIYRINIKGVYNCLHAAIPLMKKQQKGVILNIASIAGIVGLKDRFAYSMSKAAVASMTLSVAKDYIDDGIRCNSVAPARVHTPFVDDFIKKNYPGKEKEMFEKLEKSQPIGRMAKPVEIANLVLYLCSDEASFITGCDYPIDGGFIKLQG